MPNLITHAIFAHEILKELKGTELYNLIINYKKLFYIGTNGPDFLFFYTNFKCLRRNNIDINKLGGKLHKQYINDQYLYFIDYYHQQSEQQTKQQLKVYIIAHFLHWVLDSTLHPYIVYVTGFKEPNAMTYHHRLESNLDALLLKEKCNKTIKDIKSYQICSSHKKDRVLIANLYNYMVNHIFNCNVNPKIFEKALRDWKNAQRLMYSPKGIKKNLAKKIEKVEGGLSDMLVPNNYVDNIDIMNREHRMWKNPVSGDVFNNSIDELIVEAKIKALKGIKLLNKALDDQQLTPTFIELIDDRTYSNGVKGSQKRKYKQCIYK